MPVSVDARPPGLNLTFLRGTARNQPILFPAGTLAGRTFTATLDGVGLSVGIVGDTLTVSVTVAQTNAAAAGPLPFVLNETTGVDQPYIIGTWQASTRPSTVTPPTALTLVVNNETVTLQPTSGTEFPELVAGDPAEVSLATIGGTTTLSLLETIARNAYRHVAGFYYYGSSDQYVAAAITQNRVEYMPTILAAGVLDRVGVEVTTAVATGIIRVGVYLDNGGQPGNRIAEANTTADASTIGAKDLTITATIPKMGRYWLAAVPQVVAGIAVQAAQRGCLGALPIGTTLPSGTTGPRSVRQDGVTGALPATAGPFTDGIAGSVGPRVHYRYSSVV